jgi:hypothetical protein
VCDGRAIAEAGQTKTRKSRDKDQEHQQQGEGRFTAGAAISWVLAGSAAAVLQPGVAVATQCGRLVGHVGHSQGDDNPGRAPRMAVDVIQPATT